MCFDWVNEEDIPFSVKESLEYYLKTVLLLDPEKGSPYLDIDNGCVEFNGHIIKLPKKLRERLGSLV